MRIFLFVFLLGAFAQAEETITLNDLKANEVVSRLTDTTSLSWLAVGAVSVMSVQNSEADIRLDWKDHQKLSRYNSNLGDLLGSGIGSVLIIGSQYAFDDRRSNWKDHARALIWQTGIVQVLKFSFGKQRPGNSRDYQSFPSGHTSTAFASATALTYAYGWKAAAIAYPLAAFVGASRLSDDAHWASDVVGGAFLGTLVARASVSEDSVVARFYPVIGPEGYSLSYLYSF